MKNSIKYMFLLLTMALLVGCGSTKTVGGAEVSHGDKGSRVGIVNNGDETSMYGSVRAGGSFK